MRSLIKTPREAGKGAMIFEPAFACAAHELLFGVPGRVASSKEKDHVE